MVKGRKYYQVVRNYRENGKHRQQVLCHLGQHKSLDEAIEHERSMLSKYSRDAASQEEEAASTEAYLLESYSDRLAGKIPSPEEAHDLWYAAYEERKLLLFEAMYKNSYFDMAPAVNFRWAKAAERLWHLQRVEDDLRESILDYHEARAEAERNRMLAEEHRRQLDKYLAVRSALF